MSKHDFRPLLEQSERSRASELLGRMGEISKGKAYLEVQATLSTESEDADGGFVFVEDRPVEVYLDPVDPVGTRWEWGGGDADHDPDAPEGYLTLLARSEGDDLKGYSLRAEFLPFSMNWELGAAYKRPSSDSKAEKARVLDDALADSGGANRFLDAQSVELFESKPSSAARKYKFARLQVPRRRFPEVFSGYKTFGGGTGHVSENRLREALWGICPAPLEDRVHSMLERSQRLRVLRKLAEEGKLGLAFRTPRKFDYLFEMTEDSKAAINTCMLAACFKAFAGPEEFEVGPGKEGWRNEPVARLAGWYFMRILREYNRRSLKKKREEPKTGREEQVATAAVQTPALTNEEFDFLAQQARDDVFEAIESGRTIDVRTVVLALRESEPGPVALSLCIVDAVLDHDAGAATLGDFMHHGLREVLLQIHEAGEPDNAARAAELLKRLPA